MSTCDQIINFSHYNRIERVRGFRPPWHTVRIYVCPKCGAEHQVNAGPHNSTGPGAFVCGR